MTPSRPLYVAFATSGVAGLVYEVLWSRYLALYVGHAAYAQVLVLSVYLGGMAVGSLAASGVSKRVGRPLLWYAVAEMGLALFGIAFHPVFVTATELSYDVVFPALGSAALAGSLRWSLAGAMILPQAMVLGATFPFMAAGLVRADADHPGGAVATAYLLNTLGGAVGVLLAGFWMIGHLGLPGTSVAAAGLNLAAASLVWLAIRAEQVPARPPALDDAEVGAPAQPSASPVLPPSTPSPSQRAAPWGLLLTVSFGTALASFAYEVGWIRMLSLVLGSATHSFELMLSAFILGLAVGAWWIRGATDRSDEPLRLLGWIQVAMALTALVSIPVYLGSFDAMSWLAGELPGRAGGYALFNVGRYGLCLMVMLPATILAGMTLPLITGSLLRAGHGERAIGAVYGVNTIGSVVGAASAGLLALPFLGLKGLITAGAALDALLGLGLLQYCAVRVSGRRTAPAVAFGLTVVIFASVHLGARLSPGLLASGVFRRGDLSDTRHIPVYYRDGRTATVSAHVGRSDGVIVLSTNGKPDASIGPRWLMEGRDTASPRPIAAGRDFTTQVLAPTVTLAHHARARTAANIGHGSGISGAALLTSSTLERLVTIEIEPLMVEGSMVFLPANETVFADPRSTFVFDDAKSFLSYGRERFDLIFTEPSNPWVTGTGGLFTVEFYERASRFLEDGGVFGQWLQIYELNDDLFLSVLAALDRVFPFYRAYLVGDADLAIVARRDAPVGEPDWSVVRSQGFRRLTAGAPEFTHGALDALVLFDESTLRPLLKRGAVPNSDFRPVLDLGAERARFLQTQAEGVYSFATGRVDLRRALSSVESPPAPYSLVPAHGLAPAVLSGRAAWLRQALAVGGGIAPEEFPEWSAELVHLRTFLEMSELDTARVSWQSWAAAFGRAEAALHWGTSHWIDTTFHASVYDFLEREGAPPRARAAVDLMHAYSLRDWTRATRAADGLIAAVAAGERWVDPATLLDVAVLSYLHVGRTSAARQAVQLLVPRTGRSSTHLRNRLLDALVSEAEQLGDDRGPPR